jgi:hypothetical protein
METDVQKTGPSKKMVWAGRIVSAIPVSVFLMTGVMKLARPGFVMDGFKKFGYPEWEIPVLGVVELLCTILYLIPPTSILGAILLTGYLGGATATHARVGDPAFVGAILVGVLVWLGLLLRESRLRPLLPLRS